jgi:hypothetical protein
MLWQKTYGGPGYDEGFSAAQTSDGGYIVVGYTKSYSAPENPSFDDVYLIKTDSNGNMLWQKTYGGPDRDAGHSVLQTNDGGYIIIGDTRSYGAGGSDVYLIKTDSNGNMIWQKTYGGTEWDEGYSLAQTNDGGYIVVGYTKSYGAGDDDVYLIKTDTNGNLLWQKTYGGPDWDVGFSLALTSDGGYIITGERHPSSAYYLGDVYLIKTDSNGNMLWQKTYGGPLDDFGVSVAQTGDGGYIIAGEKKESYGATKSYAGNYDVYLIKTDSNGNMLWQKTYGGPDFDNSCSVLQTIDGGYIIAGYTESYGAGGGDVWLIKISGE